MAPLKLNPRLATVFIGACVFLSGLCALVYQSVWLREFRLIFGASTAASAAVLAVFMGGLGLGSAVLGRRAERARNPFQLYAVLELSIALSAFVTPWLLALARWVYTTMGGTQALGVTLGVGLRLVLAALVLLVPTFLMGGTLPAVVRAVLVGGDLRRRQVGLLYAVNTFGAVTGVVLATFLLLELLGNRQTLWSACCLNLAVAFAARVGSQSMEPIAPPAPASARSRGRTESDEPAAAPLAPRDFVVSAAALVGFAFFLMEMVWYRMLGPLLGGSTFTFGLILALALFGIATGSLIYTGTGRGRAVTLPGFALVCALEAVCLAVPYALGDRLALLAVTLQPLGNLGFFLRVVTWTVVAGIVVVPASVVAGFQFPMLIGLLGRGRHQVGADTGAAYAWNTAGAIAGSVAGGFGLLRVLGAPGIWVMVVLMLVILAAAALAIASYQQRRLRVLIAPVGAMAAAVLCCLALGPTGAWRHSPIGAGRVLKAPATVNEVEEFLRNRRGIVLWDADGIESSVALLREDGLAFAVNGKVDGHARADAGTQVMCGLLGALIHPQPARSLVIGLGTGSTAGWLGRVGTMERVKVVELEPAMVHVAAQCAPVNQHVLANPKIEIRFGDAREVLLTDAEQYDVIASEPSNPYRAGVASLFTREFYAAVARRLRPGGVFAQWVQAYEVDGESISTIYATLAAVFAEIETWQTQSGDLLFIGSQQPFVHDAALLRRRVGEEPFRTALAKVWRVTDVEGVFARYLANSGLPRAVTAADPPLNTDDNTRLEFAFAKAVGRYLGFNEAALRQLARAQQYNRPTVVGGEIDWDAVRDRLATAAVVDRKAHEADAEAAADHRARCAAKRVFNEGDFEGALKLWRTQPREPADLVELLLVARGHAATGDPAAVPYIERLHASSPGEGLAVLACYHARRGQWDEAIQAMEEALLIWQHDPWPMLIVVEETLGAATRLAGQPARRDLALRLCGNLKRPFAVHIADEERMAAWTDVVEGLQGPGAGVLRGELMAAREPHYPWLHRELRLRASWSAQSGEAHAAMAARELARFERNAGRPFIYVPREQLPPAGPRSPSFTLNTSVPETQSPPR